MTKPLYSLSPQELADQGIPVEVALRARIDEAHRQFGEALEGCGSAWHYWDGVHAGLRDTLAIIEAKR